MRFVVDASVLVAELLRESGRERLQDKRLELFLAEHMWGEVQHELPRRAKAFARHHQLATDAIEALVELSLAAVRATTAIVPEVVYSPMEDEARWRCVRDQAGWPAVALALILNAAIWTEDRDFFGTGVPTWSTATIRAWLDRSPPLT